MSRFDKWPKGAWSHSKWARLRTCPKAFNLKYNERLYRIGEKPAALEIGSCFHRGLEIVGVVALDGRQTDQDEWDDAIRIARRECKSPHAGLEATRLFAAYQKEYGLENAGYGHYQIKAVEEVMLGGDLHAAHGGYAAIADAELEDDLGELVAETKTAARIPSGTDDEICQALAMQDQVLGLAFCGHKKYGRIPRVLRNIVTKTRLVGFKRLEVTVTDEALEKWERDQTEAEQLIGLTCANRDACAPIMGYKCEYFEHCHGTATGMDKDVVDGMYYRRKEGQHEEPTSE